ncbi:MAG: metallophosphoesterase [Azonexus sp.]|jgi:hypothetical protein|nr:metallophosphoesterase [Azonexus sp.]
MAKKTAYALFAAIVSLTAALALFYFYTHPRILRIPPDPFTADNITFYALGDQGNGSVHQWAVAHAMEAQAEQYGKVDFVTLLGDNFYNGQSLTLDSPAWQSRFDNVYTGTYLSAIPFYAILGNHDPATRNGRNVEIEYARRQMGSNRWRMPANDYVVDFGRAADRPLLRIVFLDTNLTPTTSQAQASLIRESFADKTRGPIWKIVAGHHPIKSFGKHYGENIKGAASIAAALKDAGVDLYLSGHDHNQQLIAADGDPLYLISGGGGGSLYKIRQTSPELRFAREGHGFVSIHADAASLSIDLLDKAPRVLAAYRIARACADGPAACLKPTPP